MDPWGPLPPGVYAPGGVFTYMMPDHDQQLQALPLPLPLPLPFHSGGSQSGTSRHGSGHMGSRVRLSPRPSRLSSVHRFPWPPDSSTPLNPSGSASFQSPTSANSPRPRRRRRSSFQSHSPPLTNASSQPHHHRRRRRRRTRTRSERSPSHSPRGRRRSTRSNRSRSTLLPLTEEETTLHAPNDGNGEAQTHHSSPRLSSSAAAAAVSRWSTTPPPDNTNNTSNSNTSYHTALPFLLSEHNTPVTDPIFRQAEASMVMAGEYPGAFTREEERVLYDLMMRARRPPLTLPEAGREADWRFGRDFSGLGWGDY